MDFKKTKKKLILNSISSYILKKLKRNLDSFNSVYKKGNLNKIPEDEFLQKVLPAFPEKGGIRDLVLDMWLKVNQ